MPKRAPKVQHAAPDTRKQRGLSAYRANSRGWTGYVCTYCGKPITWNQMREGSEIDSQLAQDPQVPKGTLWRGKYARPLPARHTGPKLSDLVFGRVNYQMAHRWCRLKALLGPKRARAHRPAKRKGKRR